MPSGSLLELVKEHTSSVQFEEKSALGGWFGVGQLTENEIGLVVPAVMVTGCEAPPLTVQFGARPVRVTVWPPVASPVKVTIALFPIGWLPPPLTDTV